MLYLDEIREAMGTTEGIQIRIDADMREYFYNGTQHAFAESRIITKKLGIIFVGPQPMVFKPGMPLEGQVAVMYNDVVPLEEDTLAGSKLTLIFENQYKAFHKVTYEGYDEHYEDDDLVLDRDEIFEAIARTYHQESFRTSGIARYKADVPADSQFVRIMAYFKNPDNPLLKASTEAFKAHAENDHYIHVRSSTDNIAVGQYVIIHVKTNFPFDHFDWMIVSKDIIIHSGREYGDNIHSEVRTFSIVTSPEMAPGFHIFVFAHTNTNHLVSDSAYYPVESLHSHQVEFKTVQAKNHRMSTVELTCRGDPGSIFLVSPMRHSIFAFQGIFMLTKSYLLQSLHGMEMTAQELHKISTTDLEVEKADNIIYFPSPNREMDTKSIFNAKNLFFFSNYLTLSERNSSKNCSETESPCMTDNFCFKPAEKCDGIKNCPDGIDELNCIDVPRTLIEQMRSYKLSRQARNEDFYDLSDGEWAWLEVNIDEDREQFYTMEVPESPDDFWFHVFSMSKENGIGITLDTYNTIRPIDFYCEAPHHVHRGEQVGIRCIVLNRSPFEIEAVLVLEGSDDYSFIHVEEYGHVVSYAPRLAEGNTDNHHFVWLRPESEIEVYTPIAIHLEQGFIEVALDLNTQILTVKQEMTIDILPEGSTVHRHTSVLLDLKNRANVLQFMNIIVDETPIIPYEVYRRYVAGSPNAHITVSGDVIGPIFPNDDPVYLDIMFPSGHGRVGKGTEFHLFNLAANTWQLHYLRLTNQLTERFDLAKRTFKVMNVELSGVMRRFSAQGGVSNWDTSSPSVWLTAWAIRIMSHVSFQDWEDYIYVDPLVNAATS